MDMSLSKLQELVMDREAWPPAAHGVAKSRTRLIDRTELNWTGLLGFPGGASDKIIHLPMQETPVRSLGQEDPLEREMATHSSILAWEIPWKRSLAGYSPRSCKKSDTASDKKTDDNSASDYDINYEKLYFSTLHKCGILLVWV